MESQLNIYQLGNNFFDPQIHPGNFDNFYPIFELNSSNPSTANINNLNNLNNNTNVNNISLLNISSNPLNINSQTLLNMNTSEYIKDSIVNNQNKTVYNKNKPNLNISKLPPVFELPRIPANMYDKITNNSSTNNLNNMRIMRYQRGNLGQIKNNQYNQNVNNLQTINLVDKKININNNLNCNLNSNVNNELQSIGGNDSKQKTKNFRKPILKPIDMNARNKTKTVSQNEINENFDKDSYNSNQNNKQINFNFGSKAMNNVNNINLINSNNEIYQIENNIKSYRQKSIEKLAKTSEYYYQIIKNELGKQEISKLEKHLRDKEMNNNSIINNRNFIDKNIIIVNGSNDNNSSINNINVINKNDLPQKSINELNAKINNSLSLDNYNYNFNYNYSAQEFVYINKTNTECFHIPSLKIYKCIKISKESYNLFEEYIHKWKKIEHSFCELIVIYLNDNNSYNIFVEKTVNGSLKNLLNYCGCLEENMIKNITKQLINTIPSYLYKIKSISNEDMLSYNFLDIENIYFTYKYNIKVFPGIFKSYQNNNKKNFYNEDIFIVSDCIKKLTEEKNYIKLYFLYLGILIINTNLSIFNKTINHFLYCVKLKKSKDYKYEEEYCCLYHCLYSENNLFKNIVNKEMFSENYINFLHEITGFGTEFKLDNIKNHPWLEYSEFNKVKNTLSELINLGKNYDFNNLYYNTNNNIINFDLLCDKIYKGLNGCQEYFNSFSISSINHIQIDLGNLSKELRIDKQTIESRLLTIYKEFFENRMII